jgi:hypothetical protein
MLAAWPDKAGIKVLPFVHKYETNLQFKGAPFLIHSGVEARIFGLLKAVMFDGS